MNKHCLRKLTALAAAFAMLVAVGLPALAAPSLDELEYGDYEVSSIHLEVPELSAEQIEYGYSLAFSGPDVSADGTVYMEQGNLYNFTLEQTLPASTFTNDQDDYGLDYQFALRHLPETPGYDYGQYIPIDGKALFGYVEPDTPVQISVIFEDVYLREKSSFTYNESELYGPVLDLYGRITIELRTKIAGTFELGNIAELEKPCTMEQACEQIVTGMEKNFDQFSTPQEIVCRVIHLDHPIIVSTSYASAPADVELMLGYGQDRYYESQLQGETYSCFLRNASVVPDGLIKGVFSIGGILKFRATDWTLVPYHPDDYSYPERSIYDEFPISGSNSGSSSSANVSPATAATVTVGAGAAALGGSALTNVLGDALTSTASNLIVPDTTGTELPPADLPTDDRKKYLTGDEESDNPVSGDGDDPGEATSSVMDKSTDGKKLTKWEEEDTPELPEADSPEVSMSLSAPGSDLLNTKGGAVDITVEITCGEGYTWHYIPAVIVPGAQKAILPAIIGQRHLATLVLNITGTTLAERHHPVFVNLIAWARTPDGKIIKTSSSMELKLHEKGLEAKRDKNGKLTVTAYGETTLKGYAEIRELSSEEYRCTEMPDRKLNIQAVDETLGNTIV